MARCATKFTGSPWAFLGAVAVLLTWVVYAAPRHFDNESQIPINSITTIVTFLMVFLIQNAQNHEGKALQIKIDELIRSTSEARNRIVKAENMTEEELNELDEEFEHLDNGVDDLEEKTDQIEGEVEGVKEDVGEINKKINH
jgi:low affinity Fe/Cu permease